MIFARVCVAVALALAGPTAAFAGDDILDAIDQARKSYQDGNLTAAKQSLDLASQLVGQKNAETFAALLPPALPGWTAGKVETATVGVAMFGASSASRRYRGPGGHDVEVRITGDSAMVMQFAQLFLNPVIAGAMGKLIKVGDQRAIQTSEGTINMVVNNKYLVTIEGSADAAAKLAYAQAVDIAKLSKM
ncbi:MAG TPA: hypothetical protein VMG39_06730 [Pseudolabrys sp.]|nr:hypothetical protein [Pseudolabrys sp.]